MTVISPILHNYEDFPDIRTFLERERLAFLSGGIGSQLALHDVPPETDGAPTIASLFYPGVLSKIHAAYADAGASILTVDTFDLSPWRREKHDRKKGAETAAKGIKSA